MSHYITRDCANLREFAMPDCKYCGGKGCVVEGETVTLCTCLDYNKLLSISHEEKSHIKVKLVQRG